MNHQPWKKAALLDRYRSYLLLLINIAPRFNGKLDASDVVQMTLLHAYQNRDQFRGETEAEFLGWLRAILESCVLQEVRKLGRHRRDVARERPLRPHGGSRAGGDDGLRSVGSTPSQRVMRAERILALADALTTLPEHQRRAIELHHLMNHSLADTAKTMGRSPEAVAGLLYRGLQKLRLESAILGET